MCLNPCPVLADRYNFNFLNTNFLIALYYEMAILAIIFSSLITKVIFRLIRKDK